MSAEYIMAGGNEQVILCERGIRTYDDYTRNTLDLAAVPMLKELTHLPVKMCIRDRLQKWPVRVGRPYMKKYPPVTPLQSGQRIVDTFFPVAKGGTAAIPIRKLSGLPRIQLWSSPIPSRLTVIEWMPASSND